MAREESMGHGIYGPADKSGIRSARDQKVGVPLRIRLEARSL